MLLQLLDEVEKILIFVLKFKIEASCLFIIRKTYPDAQSFNIYYEGSIKNKPV